MESIRAAGHWKICGAHKMGETSQNSTYVKNSADGVRIKRSSLFRLNCVSKTMYIRGELIEMMLYCALLRLSIKAIGVHIT
jgi:hypothetical protein